MSTAKSALLALLVVALSSAICVRESQAGILLYDQDFESPNGFVNDGGDVNIFRTINQNYGNQPIGFTFAQANTVETLLLTGNQAFGTGYSDPQGIGGDYAIGMLSGLSTQNDLLGLSFNVQGYNFLNFRLNISSIDLDRWGGPFNSANGSTPSFDIVLFDNPTGATSLSGNGVVLDSARITGNPSSSRSEFNWTEHIVALDASGSASGNVTLRIDLVSDSSIARYAAADNFWIFASDSPGDVGAIPEPTTIAMWSLLGICGFGYGVRRKLRSH